MADTTDIESWLADSNDALEISLSAPGPDGLRLLTKFHPKFTYPIFGEDEKIFGYKDLKIKLRYRANDMRPHLSVSHKNKFQGIGEAQPTDVAGVLRENNHLPEVAFNRSSDFEHSSKQMIDDWTPPGKLHTSFDVGGNKYEIWRGCMSEAPVKQLVNRVQIFVPLFIEGGSYICRDPESETNEEDMSDADRWTLFFLYCKQPVSDNSGKHFYNFIGYSSVYRFYYFQAPTPPSSPKGDWELPEPQTHLPGMASRTRLSQFVILPPFQGQGLGAYLYRTIFSHYAADPQTKEFTIEDPNEAFDDLRDICDLAYLSTLPEFKALHLDKNVTLPKSGPVPQLVAGGKSLEAIRQRVKIAPRQFARVLELHLMKQLPESVRPTMATDNQDQKAEPDATAQYLHKLWSLLVKQRLYRHNKDALSEMDVRERIEKLTETLGGVELEYARLLAAYERSQKHAAQQPAESNGKRKLTVENDNSSKRARTEELA